MTTKKTKETLRFLEKMIAEPITFGLVLASIRKGEDMTLDIFAAQLDISKQHLSDIEKGRKAVSPERAARFAKALGYSVERFIQLALQDQLTQAGLNYKVEVS